MHRPTNPVCPSAAPARRGPVGEVAALLMMLAPLAALILFQGH